MIQKFSERELSIAELTQKLLKTILSALNMGLSPTVEEESDLKGL